MKLSNEVVRPNRPAPPVTSRQRLPGPAFWGMAPSSSRQGTGAKLVPMVNAHETVVFRWLAAGDAGDLDAFDDLLHPDAVIHAPLGLSTTSAEKEKGVWRDALAAMPDLRHQVQESWWTAR